MDSIYKSKRDKQQVLALYDKQMSEFSMEWKDRYVRTSYGRTHLIETGKKTGEPLLVFHGGNATTAYNLRYCNFLLQDFHIYAVDTIGHPGKSAEHSLSPNTNDYGKWASEVIDALGFERMSCFGGSFGAGVLVKTMCVAPNKVKSAVLLVPSAIHNTLAIKSITMLVPMILYWITHKEKWFIRCILPMAIKKEEITKDILETARCSIDHAKIKKGMPSNAKTKELKRYTNPVYVLAAEKDCLFPARAVLCRTKEVWTQARTYLLRDRGHIHKLTEKEKKSICQFLMEQRD